MASETAARPSAVRSRRVALVGHRNVGKSTLFNALTGVRQKTANYPGTTVEGRSGSIKSVTGEPIELLDLPGTNSLVPRSPDEAVVENALMGALGTEHAPEMVVVVLDATQLRRGLYLASQVFDLGLPTLVCLNMVDDARREGMTVDAKALEAALGGVPVFTTAAARGEGVSELRDHLLLQPRPPVPAAVPLDHVGGLPGPSAERWRVLRGAAEEPTCAREEIAARWRFVEQVLERAGVASDAARRQTSDRIDRILLHPIFGPLAFLIVMGALFQVVFSLADPAIGAIEGVFETLGTMVGEVMAEGLVRDFVVEGLIAGVGGVLVFLPQILLLFLCMGLLEDSGYLTRAAFIADAPLRRVGLSGRSFIPLLSSFACAIPGVMAARTIENRRERQLAIGIAPLMTCSARVPVYSLLISTFVPAGTVLGFLETRGLVLLALYLGSIVLGGLVAFLIDRLSRGARSAMILEMPPYRAPRPLAILRLLVHRGGAFVKRAGTLILAMSLLVWAATTFPRVDTSEGAPEVTPSQAIAQSYAGQFGHAIEPAIAPLGFDWKIGIGLVGSLAAREVFVATMGVVYAVEGDEGAELDEEAEERQVGAAMRRATWSSDGRPVYDKGTVAALLVFFMIALQCLSTVGVVKRETGSWLFAGGQFLAFGALAWVLAFATRSIVMLF